MQLHRKISIPLPWSHCSWGLALVLTPLLCAILRCLFPAQVRGSKSSGCLGHTYSLRPGGAQIACSVGSQQAVVTNCSGSLWWESLPVPVEAGAGVWRWQRPRPPHALQPWCLAFQAHHTSSRGIPGRTSHPSHPLCCICAVNSIPLPRSVLPPPHFCTQPLPALADSRPRQGFQG